MSSAKYGPWAVVAGGSEGVGAEFALQLADSGIDLVLFARTPGPLEATARECRRRGVEVRTLPIDLAECRAVEAITSFTAGLEIGLLIYNAGANTASAEFLDADLCAFQRVIDLNVTTIFITFNVI